jgi:hypothetical protein
MNLGRLWAFLQKSKASSGEHWRRRVPCEENVDFVLV